MTRLMRGGQTIPSPSTRPDGVTVEDGGFIYPSSPLLFRLPLFIALAIPSDVSDITTVLLRRHLACPPSPRTRLATLYVLVLLARRVTRVTWHEGRDPRAPLA